MASDDELGVAGARRRVLQDGVLGRHPVRLVQQRVAVVGVGPGKQEWVLGVVPIHALAVLKPLQGHLVDRLCRPRSACRRRWRMTSASSVWIQGLWVAYCRKREAATPSNRIPCPRWPLPTCERGRQ